MAYQGQMVSKVKLMVESYIFPGWLSRRVLGIRGGL